MEDAVIPFRSFAISPKQRQGIATLVLWGFKKNHLNPRNSVAKI